MKKTIILMVISVLFLTGCGAIERVDRDITVSTLQTNLNEEIDKLNEESVKKDEEIKQLENEINSLSEQINNLKDTNSNIIDKLTVTEETLKTINEFFNGYPDFYIETGKLEDINEYLADLNISFLKYNKEINILNSSSNNNVIFTTTDFLNLDKEVYIWEQGETTPVLVPNSIFSNGSCEWLIEDEYIILDSGTSAIRGKKIIDVIKKEVISEFSCICDGYLIPDTTWFILNTPGIDRPSSEFAMDLSVYNFITDTLIIIEKADDIKDWEFTIDESNDVIIIETNYKEDGMSYHLEKTINMDDFVEKYCIQDETKENNDLQNDEEQDV